MLIKTLPAAIKEREEVIADFHRICEEGRQSPVPMQAFVQNRIAYLAACEEVYTALWYSISDTGVQLLRMNKDVESISNKPIQKK
jgi:hypothetical protein